MNGHFLYIHFWHIIAILAMADLTMPKAERKAYCDRLFREWISGEPSKRGQPVR